MNNFSLTHVFLPALVNSFGESKTTESQLTEISTWNTLAKEFGISEEINPNDVSVNITSFSEGEELKKVITYTFPGPFNELDAKFASIIVTADGQRCVYTVFDKGKSNNWHFLYRYRDCVFFIDKSFREKTYDKYIKSVNHYIIDNWNDITVFDPKDLESSEYNGPCLSHSAYNQCEGTRFNDGKFGLFPDFRYVLYIYDDSFAGANSMFCGIDMFSDDDEENNESTESNDDNDTNNVQEDISISEAINEAEMDINDSDAALELIDKDFDLEMQFDAHTGEPLFDIVDKSNKELCNQIILTTHLLRIWLQLECSLDGYQGKTNSEAACDLWHKAELKRRMNKE